MRLAIWGAIALNMTSLWCEILSHWSDGTIYNSRWTSFRCVRRWIAGFISMFIPFFSESSQPQVPGRSMRLATTLVLGLLLDFQRGHALRSRVPTKDMMIIGFTAHESSLDMSHESKAIQYLPEYAFIDFPNLTVWFNSPSLHSLA